MTNELLSTFAALLPRLYELKDATDQSHPDAYFHANFERRFVVGACALEKFQRIERTLAALDSEAWSDLKARADAVAHKKNAGWGWRELFDTLDEAKGYVHLQKVGCTNIGFIERHPKRKTPDPGGCQGAQRVLCEVKSIHVSQKEAGARAQMARGAMVSRESSNEITPEMLQKVSVTLAGGIKQLDSEDPNRAARRIVFTVLDFDDWVGDYDPDYIAQLDAHLLAERVAGAELVFCPANERHRFTMQSATVAEI